MKHKLTVLLILLPFLACSVFNPGDDGNDDALTAAALLSLASASATTATACNPTLDGTNGTGFPAALSNGNLTASWTASATNQASAIGSRTMVSETQKTALQFVVHPTDPKMQLLLGLANTGFDASNLLTTYTGNLFPLVATDTGTFVNDGAPVDQLNTTAAADGSVYTLLRDGTSWHIIDAAGTLHANIQNLPNTAAMPAGNLTPYVGFSTLSGTGTTYTASVDVRFLKASFTNIANMPTGYFDICGTAF